MNRTLRRALVAVAVPLAALAVSACSDSGSDGMPGMDHGSMSSASPSTGGDHSTADVQFAQMMIAHHQQAVEMSDLAATAATDPEIKTVAAQIKAAQQPEITTMSGWLAAWGQPTAQPGGHNMPGMGGMPGMMSDAEMRQLQAAKGADFDRMFARMMIAHHNGAIQMAKDVQANGTNPEVKTLAATVISSQTAEVDQLQKILDRL
ncbi:MAG: DUF305 domain-containing protein [Hamadaea sp.]|nr:DUF305 domain-containing protein [Hamadaea sp.]